MVRTGFDLLLLGVTLIVLALRASTPVAGATPAESCGFGPTAGKAAPGEPGTLEVWALAPHQHCWRAYGFLVAAAEVPEAQVQLQVFNTSIGPYRRMVAEALAQGQRPAIVYAERLDFQSWAEAGFLAPLDDCVARGGEFTQVRPELWDLFRWQEQLWAAPYNFGVSILYFSKPRLRALGWSEEQIAALPQRIRQGDFSLDDMLATAQLAVDTGVVEQGYGFWPYYHRYQTLWLTYVAFGGQLYDHGRKQAMIQQAVLARVFEFYRAAATAQVTVPAFRTILNGGEWPNGAIWRDTVAHGRVLFWQDTNFNWLAYEEAVRKQGGEGYLLDTIGIAPYPAAKRGTPGHTMVNSIGSFVFTAPKQHEPERQALACRLLMKMFSPELITRNAQKARLLGSLDNGIGNSAIETDHFIKLTEELWNYPGYPHNMDQLLINDRFIVHEYLVRVENGELAPEVAASLAVRALQSQLGDEIEIQ